MDTRAASELTFSQRHGHEPMPERLDLEQLPKRARTLLWDVLYQYTRRQMDQNGNWKYRRQWEMIFEELSTEHHQLTLEEADGIDIFDAIHRCKQSIYDEPFNRVLDLVERIMRHRSCPDVFCNDMALAFSKAQLPYTVVLSEQPTIVPAFSEEEGKAISAGLHDTGIAGLSGARAYLKKAAEQIRRGEFRDSVRESICAVESACRRLKEKDMTNAVRALERDGMVHPALGSAFVKLYGYASNEEGVRHALKESDKTNVRREEAAFMLSACAAFCSYLVQKTRPIELQDLRKEKVSPTKARDRQPWTLTDVDDVPF